MLKSMCCDVNEDIHLVNKEERNDRVSIIEALNHQIIQKTKPEYRLANYGAEDSWRGSYIGTMCRLSDQVRIILVH